MAVTGTGTQADPFIVHSYDEFISLSGHIPVADSSVYIKWFDTPNQVLDCNTYGSEFKWGAFSGVSASVKCDYRINLNGCTIKNFRIADGITMFAGGGSGSNIKKIIISNGFIRNVFLGSATSKFCGDYVEFENVSISLNFSGATNVMFNGDGHLTFDNCAMYLVASTLQAPIMTKGSISDTDIELHIADQNGKCLFNGGDTYNNYSTLTDCRITGKISGTPIEQGEGSVYSIFGCASPYNSRDTGKQCKLVNCVVDVDLTDTFFDVWGAMYYIYKASGATDLNTNVFCNSHYPSGDGGIKDSWQHPTDWNYMSHENIRNGAYLNNAGFTVVEIVDGD